MEYYINEECINCGACELECPMKGDKETVKKK